MPDSTVSDRLANFLTEKSIPFEVLEHEPVYTSEQAAEVRGVSLSSGAKALICKINGGYVLFVIPGDRRLATKHVRKELGFKKFRFANEDELLELSGLTPGAIPPFGSLWSIQTICDLALAEEEKINFNAGDHCISFSMSFKDYQTAENPRMAGLSETV